jgi:dihydrolipoamide dehydrogenase
MNEFDVAVIGGGPGGYVAAIRAAQQGACVCLVERDKVGGTCLNRGCIPTKALYSTAHLLSRLRHADAHGIGLPEPRFDFGRAAERKDQVTAKLVGGVEQLLKANKVEIFRGEGSLEGPGKIRIRRPEVTGHIRAKNIILASGSVAARPQAFPIDGKNVLTSDEILAIKELPSSLLVIGGGYIGCEFASIFAAFGTKVTIVETLPELLARTDRQAVKEVEKTLKEMGATLRTGTSVEALEIGDPGVRARFSSGEEETFDKVLVAVGRLPLTEGLGLEEAGVTVENGAIKVDERMRTSQAGIYAIGDVTNIIQLAHVASYQAEIAVKNIMGEEARADYRVVPSAIFTLPEIAQVGLTEDDCRSQGRAIEVGRFSYQAGSKAICEGETRGLIKVLTDAADGAIIGACMVGAEASTMIAEVTVAMQQRLTATQLGEIIHAHPTMPEMTREAAEDSAGLAVHKVGRRRGNER